jgi:hypothetical protein
VQEVGNEPRGAAVAVPEGVNAKKSKMNVATIRSGGTFSF